VIVIITLETPDIVTFATRDIVTVVTRVIDSGLRSIF